LRLTRSAKARNHEALAALKSLAAEPPERYKRDGAEAWIRRVGDGRIAELRIDWRQRDLQVLPIGAIRAERSGEKCGHGQPTTFTVAEI
jgi:hypothetical protein